MGEQSSRFALVFQQANETKGRQSTKHIYQANDYQMKLLEKYILRWQPSSFVVLGLKIEGEEISPFSCISCTIKKGQVIISNQEIDSDLNRQLEGLKNKALLIQLEGPGIIHRPLEEGNHEVLKSGELVEVSKVDEPYYTIAKAEAIERVADFILKKGVSLVGLELGCSGFYGLQKPTSIESVGHYSWADVPFYNPVPAKNITFQGERTNTYQVSLYLRAISWLQSSPEEQTYYSWGWTRLTKSVQRFGFAALLGVLFINFLLYQPLYNEVSELQNIANSAGFRGWQKQKDVIAQREKFVQLNTENDPGKRSWYADRLLATMPSGIHLETLQVSYIKGVLRSGKAPQHEENTIRIQGIAPSNTEVQAWLTHIDTISWIKDASLTDYGIQGNNAIFQLEINTQIP